MERPPIAGGDVAADAHRIGEAGEQEGGKRQRGNPQLRGPGHHRPLLLTCCRAIGGSGAAAAGRLGGARVSPWRSHEEDDEEREREQNFDWLKKGWTIFQMGPFLSREIQSSIVGMLCVIQPFSFSSPRVNFALLITWLLGVWPFTWFCHI